MDDEQLNVVVYDGSDVIVGGNWRKKNATTAKSETPSFCKE